MRGRILIDYVLPLVLPTLFYVAYQVWRARHAGAAGRVSPALRGAPWGWLAATGLALAAATLITALLRTAVALAGLPSWLARAGPLLGGGGRGWG